MHAKGLTLLVGFLITLVSQVQAANFDLQAEKAVEIGFDTVSGRYYQLQRSPNVEPAVWSNYGEPFKGDGTRNYGFTRTTSSSLSIFRLVEYDLSNGLIAHYPFNGNANDSSANLNHGTVMGATLTTDRFGNQNSAYSFNGVNQYIFSANQSYLNFGASDFSISLWASYANNATNRFLIGKSNGQFEQDKWIVYHDYSPAKYSFHVNTPSANSTFSGQATWSFDSNNWHHVVITRSGSTYKTYINGVLSGQSSGPASIASTTAALTMGMVEAAGYMHGKLDDVRIYNRALSLAEVQILTKDTEIDLSSSLVAHYSLDGNANDSSSNLNHGSVVGATLTTDRFGNANSAYYFNGVDQLIQAPHQPYLNLSGTTYTVTFWAKFDGSSSVKHILGKSAGAFNNNKWIVYYSNVPSQISMHINLTSSGSFFPALASFPYDTTTWHHFAVTKSGSTYSTYIDGQKIAQGSGPSTITGTTAPMTIGSVEGLSWFKGSLDDIRIYQRDLNPSEVKALFIKQN